MLTSGPITKHLLDTYGLRGTFLFLAAIVSHIIPCGMLLRTPPNKGLTTKRKENRCEYLKDYIILFKTPAYMCVLLGSVLWNISFAVIMIHLPNYVVHAGFSKHEASFMFTAIGIGTILPRLTIGLAIGPDGLDPLLLNFGLTALAGGLIAIFPLFITYSTGPIIFASLYGVYIGGLLVFTVPLCLEMAGMDKLTSAIGLWYFFQGLGSFTGPPLEGKTSNYIRCIFEYTIFKPSKHRRSKTQIDVSTLFLNMILILGLVFDMTGSYGFSFILAGLLTLIAAGCSLLASVWRKKSPTQQEFNSLAPEENKDKLKNSDDISREQGQKVMSNDA
ncbi:monocarboxylate transporter 11-like isoform X1 [Ostrea edulis]|uniref:monocarboxylate transporter 11-like isoform X1 n=1 Tax=Ostrea edulis TaxID=37623 RepID=UPI0024AFDD14|nr:monocarboxylate transporter 11-like isoform X1 [Ostrea edulis]